jgi:hypothetical protein
MAINPTAGGSWRAFAQFFGLLCRRMNIDLPEELPLPARAFIVWLTVILWKRDADAAGVTGAGGS